MPHIQNNTLTKVPSKKRTMLALPIETAEDPQVNGPRNKPVHNDGMVTNDIPFISLDPGD